MPILTCIHNTLTRPHKNKSPHYSHDCDKQSHTSWLLLNIHPKSYIHGSSSTFITIKMKASLVKGRKSTHRPFTGKHHTINKNFLLALVIPQWYSDTGAAKWAECAAFFSLAKLQRSLWCMGKKNIIHSLWGPAGQFSTLIWEKEMNHSADPLPRCWWLKEKMKNQNGGKVERRGEKRKGESRGRDKEKREMKRQIEKTKKK